MGDAAVVPCIQDITTARLSQPAFGLPLRRVTGCATSPAGAEARRLRRWALCPCVELPGALVVTLRVLALAGFVMAASKTHGRQLRLEREREGHWSVDFRGTNPPFVVAMWRRDRRTFWSAFLALGTIAVAVSLRWGHNLPRPLLGWLGFTLGMAFGGAFVVAGLASSFRLLARNRQPPPPDPTWWLSAHRGSLLWWSLVAGLGIACAGLAVLV